MEVKAIPQTALPLADLQVPQARKLQKAAQQADPAVKKVARDFETLFVSLMLKSMRSTVGEDKLTGGGHGEEVYRSLLDEQYATEAAKTDTLGLARTIEKELTRRAPMPAKDVTRAD